MKKTVIFCCVVCLGSIVVSLTGQEAKAEEIKVSTKTSAFSPIEEHNNFKMKTVTNVGILPNATLTKYWTSGWIKTGNPAPQLAFFQSGAYRGWLSKYRELPSSFGTTGYYEGYFYHNSLPLPIPSRFNFNIVE